jgi:hypothetical protein
VTRIRRQGFDALSGERKAADEPGMVHRVRARGIPVLAALAGAATLLPGCGLVGFDVSQDIPAQTIPGSPLGALLPASLFAIPMNIDIQSETAGHGTGPASSVTLKSITLRITSPSGATFDFVSSISISISSSGNASLPQKEIARLQPVPGTATISLPPSSPSVDLLPYINAGATITATASGHMPSSDTTFDGTVVVTVHV